MIEDIRDYIATKTNIPVFYSRVPAMPDDCIVILSYYGSVPDLKFTDSYPRFQIRCRSFTESDSMTYAMICFNALHGFTNGVLGTTDVFEIRALQDPYQLELDEKDRVIVQQNFEAHIFLPTTYRSN